MAAQGPRQHARGHGHALVDAQLQEGPEQACHAFRSSVLGLGACVGSSHFRGSPLSFGGTPLHGPREGAGSGRSRAASAAPGCSRALGAAEKLHCLEIHRGPQPLSSGTNWISIPVTVWDCVGTSCVHLHLRDGRRQTRKIEENGDCGTADRCVDDGCCLTIIGKKVAEYDFS